MERIPLKQLAAGMILARDVENVDGHRILAKGTVLTDSTIVLLSGWGIPEAFVEPPSSQEDEKTTQAEPQAVQIDYCMERLNKSFEGRLVNDWMKALHEQAAKHLDVRRRWGGAP